MNHPPNLASLGPRIMLMGPSNAGKSTLAVALAHKLDFPVVHLDQLRHQPNTDWVRRPTDEFAALHNAAITGETWIIEGNYSDFVQARLERATGVILINTNRWIRLAQYLNRTLITKSGRAGHLDGAQDSLKWEMVDWVLFRSPARTRRAAQSLDQIQQPFVYAATARGVNRLYDAWSLQRP